MCRVLRVTCTVQLFGEIRHHQGLSYIKNILSLNHYLANIFVLKLMPAYYVSCVYSNSHQNTFTMGENSMNTDQTAPKGAV